MDDNTVIEVESAEVAQEYCDQLYAARLEQARAAGYTIIDNQIIPKDLATGEDILGATRVTTYDKVRVTDTGSAYFTNPGRDQLEDAAGVVQVGFQEVRFDPSWIDTDEAPV